MVSSLRLPRFERIGTPPFKEFETLADSIIKEWAIRGDSQRRSPYESAYGYLKREAYRVICHYIEAGHARFFEMVIKNDGRNLSKVVKLQDNPFHYGLRAMFVDDEIVDAQDIYAFSTQMLYAYRHRVTPEFLVGFIYQCGSRVEIRKRLKSDICEKGFEGVYRDLSELKF